MEFFSSFKKRYNKFTEALNYRLDKIGFGSFFKKGYNEFAAAFYEFKFDWYYKNNAFVQGALLNKSSWKSYIDKSTYHLSKGGICNGLVIDYARHIVSHENTNKDSNYIAKLKRKTSNYSENFNKRIENYHSKLQVDELFDTNIKKMDITQRDNLLGLSMQNHPNSSVLALSFADDKQGHIIAIHIIKNTEGQITGYKVFDPNFGEFDCNSSKNSKQNTNECNKILKDLFQYYTYNGLDKNISSYDLANLVIKSGFVKKSAEYKKSDK